MHTRYSDRRNGTPGPVRARFGSREDGQTIMLYTLLLPFLVIPLVGLAMDSTKVFIVREKLQGSVDGAAIAAAQSMNTGSDNTAWTATALATATQFVNEAFPTGYFSTSGLTVSANVPAPALGSRIRTVTVTGTVQTALAFPSLLGFGKFSVSASGQATRRDVVLVMLIDRSGSMSELSSVKSAAKAFVGDFTPGRDKLALVLIGGSSIIAYPPLDWDVDPFGGSLNGPDSNFATDNPPTHPAITTQLTNMNSGSNTGTAEGLWYAYQELLKADETGALNAIVLFTDGMPNGITAVFNGVNSQSEGTASGLCNNGTSVRVNSGTNTSCATPPSAAFANAGGASTCTNKLNGSTNPIKGWMALQGGYANTGNTSGVDQLAQFMSSSTLATLVTTPSLDQSPTTTNSANCYFASNQYNVSKDVVIPDYDYYGDSTAGASPGKTSGGGSGTYSLTDYQKSEIFQSTTACAGPGVQSPEVYDPYHAFVTTGTGSTITYGSANSCQIGLASWNATDMAAMWIRYKGAVAELAPVIFTMGFAGNNGNNNQDDPTLMLRLANVKSYTDTSTTPKTLYTNSVFDTTAAPGMYIRITTTSDINPAFQAVAAQIVRLSM
jgi:Mg-chelatase subunit ChlD